VVPGGRANRDFVLFAYRMFPVRFEEGKQRPFPIPHLEAQPLPAGYCRLGYDAVSYDGSSTFGCSPLSCNHAAEYVAVNSHCLVEYLADAFRLAALISRAEEGYEPGPYHVVEVLREARVE
jgi:hypothetical protein